MKNDEQNKEAQELISALVSTYEDGSGINFIDVANLPARGKILELLDLFLELIFPGYMGTRTVTQSNVKFIVGDIICKIRTEFADQIELALKYQCRVNEQSCHDCRDVAGRVTGELLKKLPGIRQLLKEDVSAAYDGDPAAKSFEEVVISYPYIRAIAVHRLAHELYLMKVPLISRIMSESAHSQTGIDIHPGAKIGKRFFIDHGTGVVIGETTVIGDNVKLYQGVTLGAVSFPKDKRGRLIKGAQRHPTIEDDVTIYAEATILGNVRIGAGATIGGNVWVKEDVPSGTTIMMVNPEAIYKHSDGTKEKK